VGRGFFFLIISKSQGFRKKCAGHENVRIVLVYGFNWNIFCPDQYLIIFIRGALRQACMSPCTVAVKIGD